MSPQTSDNDLLQRFIADDQEAFAVLVARHHGVVRAACARQAMPGESDDCVQAVFLVLARRPTAALRAGNLPGWLVRAAWFVCRHSRRAAVRRHQAEHDAAQLSATAPAGPVPESEALAQLDDCLQRLPARQRAAVTLHYLAGQSADEVATSLGISRDNAYQLLSRGLAGLRGLLARRGVALSVAALGALLGGQAQAATSSGIIATLSASPSPTATALAHGAMTAMTIATATPFALAAGLLLAVGLTTSALTAEHAPPVAPPPALTAPVAASAVTPPAVAGQQADDTAWRRAIEAQLQQEITLDFQDQDLAEVVSFLHKVTNANIIVYPMVIAAAPPPITLKVDKMQLKFVLAFIMKLTSLDYTLRDGAIFIAPADIIAESKPPAAPAGVRITSGAHLEGAPLALRDRLAQRVTFDFQDTPSDDVFQFLRQVSGVNIVIAPAFATRARTVTLRVLDMPLKDALSWLAELQAIAITAEDGALYVSAPADAPVQPAGTAGAGASAAGAAAVPAQPTGVAF